jgi:glycosyltransferase involved in cell wall biosynthesis
MIVSLDLTFSVPIWRLYYENDNKYNIPYEFIYNSKKYTNGITIVQFGWYIWEERFINNTDFLNEIEITNKLRNCIFCVSTQEELGFLKKYRPSLRCCLANQNAFIDENVYKIQPEVEKKYDLIVSSSWSFYKNLHLIKNLNNVCTMGYYTTDTDNVINNISNSYCMNFEERERTPENYTWIKPSTVCKYNNMCKIGGIFSTMEGVCYSSSEYLLCGIPVLSCKCKGGREIWYNENNSILCDDNESSVIENLNLMLSKYDNGEYNSEKIRNDHIELMKLYRINLTETILEVFTPLKI